MLSFINDEGYDDNDDDELVEDNNDDADDDIVQYSIRQDSKVIEQYGIAQYSISIVQ